MTVVVLYTSLTMMLLFWQYAFGVVCVSGVFEIWDVVFLQEPGKVFARTKCVQM